MSGAVLEALRARAVPARPAWARSWSYRAVSVGFLASGFAALAVADLAVTTLHPWIEMMRLARGIVQPDFHSIDGWSVIWTVAFAVVGVSIGASAGLLLAIGYAGSILIRTLAVILRSIHELFWALLLIQVFGLGPATGVLAIALPYTGIFAKVFAEMIEEADLSAVRVLPTGASAFSAFAFATRLSTTAAISTPAAVRSRAVR